MLHQFFKQRPTGDYLGIGTIGPGSPLALDCDRMQLMTGTERQLQTEDLHERARIFPMWQIEALSRNQFDDMAFGVRAYLHLSSSG